MGGMLAYGAFHEVLYLHALTDSSYLTFQVANSISYMSAGINLHMLSLTYEIMS